MQFSATLGHEWVAALGVMGALFAGMAGGAAWLAPRAERSAYAGRWFAGLEAIIGLWGLVLAWTLPAVLPIVSPWLGDQPQPWAHAAIALGLPLLLMLPSTVAMGATWPALSRATQAGHGAMGWLYASHTAGALLGLLVSVFLLVPAWGLQRSALLIALFNLLCAIATLVLFSRSDAAQDIRADAEPVGASARNGLLALGLLGLLGIGYETLCIRMLSQVGENTVYSYAVMVGVFLLGTAVGALPRLQRVSADVWILVTGAAVAGGSATLWWAADLARGLSGEVIVALCALLVPAMAMGGTFTAMCRWALSHGTTLGSALATNMVGAALAPALVGVVCLPLLGPAATCCVLVGGYGLLALGFARHDQTRSDVQWLAIALMGAAVVAAPLLAPLRHIDVAPGGEVLRHIDGPMAAVSVTQDQDGVLRLRINNRVQEGSSAASPVEARLALLPLMLHPHPQRALFLGWGTGYTARVAALDDTLQVQAVELLPEVISASALFDAVSLFPSTRAKVQVVQADARRYALASEQRYDLIVADLFHPARSGAGSLYTVEHYRALRSRLEPGGVVCQWLALYQMELGTLRSVMAAFRTVFPDAVVVLASNSLDTPVIGLVARRDAPFEGPQVVAQRMAGASAGLQQELQRTRLIDAQAVLGSMLGGSSGMQRWLGNTAANSDDHPAVTYGAPWDTYRPQTTPSQRLGLLLSQLGEPDARTLQADLGWDAGASGAVGAPTHDDASILTAYIQARNRYLLLGLSRPDLGSSEGREALAKSLQLLLSVSPQFGPAVEALRTLQHLAKPIVPSPLTP